MTEYKCNIKLWNVVKFAKRKVHLKQSKNTSLLSASAYSKQHNSVKFVKYIPEGDALVLQTSARREVTRPSFPRRVGGAGKRCNSSFVIHEQMKLCGRAETLRERQNNRVG